VLVSKARWFTGTDVTVKDILGIATEAGGLEAGSASRRARNDIVVSDESGTTMVFATPVQCTWSMAVLEREGDRDAAVAALRDLVFGAAQSDTDLDQARVQFLEHEIARLEALVQEGQRRAESFQNEKRMITRHIDSYKHIARNGGR